MFFVPSGDDQYDYLTTHDGTNWDHFGWSTSATTYGMSTSTTDGDYAGDFVDWGATMGSGWRTMTSAEWTYLFRTRASGATVFNTDDARYTQATINTDGTPVNGVILFPDGVTISGIEVTTDGTVNGRSDWTTKCTAAQWTALEAKGCVFLPAAGDRNGATMNRANSYGYYWASTVESDNNPQNMVFRSNSFNPGAFLARYAGITVRLVRPVE